MITYIPIDLIKILWCPIRSWNFSRKCRGGGAA